MPQDVYDEMDQESGARLVKVTPFPPGHPLREKALAREKARRAGTHAHHPRFGLVPRERAEALVRDGHAKRSEFQGHPETGKVSWWDGVAELERARDAYPTGPDDEVDAAELAAIGVGSTDVEDDEPAATPPPVPGAVEIKRRYHVAGGRNGDEPSERAYTGTELKAMVKTGELRRDSLVFTPGLGSWTKAGETHELGPLFPPPPIAKQSAPSSSSSTPATGDKPAA